MNNDNEEPLEDLRLEMKPTAFGKPRCTVCGQVGEVAVTRLDTGNLVVDATCRLHWPPGAITPDEWVDQERVRCQAFPHAYRMTRYELLFWLLGGTGGESLQ